MKIYIKKNNTYRYLFYFGIAFFILSNVYFGWNKTSQSGAESVCDLIWQVSIIMGGIGKFVRDVAEETIGNIIIK